MSWWEHAYRSGRVGWDPGEYDGHLRWFLDKYSVGPCRVLDPGCGTGKSAVWLAQKGFHAVGIDLSPSAIAQARQRARDKDVSDRTRFLEGRFPDDLPRRDANIATDSYDLIIERAFLQHLGHGRALEKTVDILADALEPEGLFYSLMIAAEGASGHWGIVRWSKRQIRSALEPRFTIIEMRRDVFTPGEPGSVPAWITVLKPD
jgi:SAM-dependent methyltransferase